MRLKSLEKKFFPLQKRAQSVEKIGLVNQTILRRHVFQIFGGMLLMRRFVRQSAGKIGIGFLNHSGRDHFVRQGQTLQCFLLQYIRTNKKTPLHRNKIGNLDALSIDI